MEQVLTLSEIEARYPGEWILVAEPEFDENLEVRRGRVVFHSKDRDEMYRKDAELGLESAAYLYTGAIPEEAVVVL